MPNIMTGDMPNIKWKAWDRKIPVWKTVKRGRYCLQFNRLSGSARILNEDNVRIAWGSRRAMEKRFDRLTNPVTAKRGDVIRVTRLQEFGGIYEHYAVYIGNNRVIHYAAEEGDFGGEPYIHEAPMEEFLRDNKEYEVVDFPDSKGMMCISRISLKKEFEVLWEILRKMLLGKEYHLYSPEETVARARSRIGERRYNLIVRNCEHFAVWCKTGVSESHQVERVLKFLLFLPGRLFI